jgi:geranyl-CoA carboxylase alpha subunit
VPTNQAFLMSCLRHPAFARGEATTEFIGKHRNQLLAAGGDTASDVTLAALLLHVSSPHARQVRRGRTLAATFSIPMRAEIDGVVHELDVMREREGDYVATFGGISHRFEIHEASRDTVRFRHDGVMERVTLLRDGGRLSFQHRGLTRTVRDLTLAAPETAATGGDGKVRAAMNGRVVAVLVKKGDHVEADQPVMTLEAMKMEHVHVAGIAGTIATIDVIEGEQVTTGKVVIEIETALN